MLIPIDVENLIDDVVRESANREMGLKTSVRNFKRSLANFVLEKVEGDRKSASDILEIKDRTLCKIVKFKP
jgi:DNA-binding NtrC family response regulator